MENVFVDLLIVQIDNIWMKVLLVVISNLRKGWALDPMVTLENVIDCTLHHLEGRQAEQIELDEAHGLKMSDVLTFCPWRLTNAA